nr:hypothetical protein [Pandoravirus aubagnensis]
MRCESRCSHCLACFSPTVTYVCSSLFLSATINQRNHKRRHQPIFFQIFSYDDAFSCHRHGHQCCRRDTRVVYDHTSRRRGGLRDCAKKDRPSCPAIFCRWVLSFFFLSDWLIFLQSDHLTPARTAVGQWGAAADKNHARLKGPLASAAPVGVLAHFQTKHRNHRKKRYGTSDSTRRNHERHILERARRVVGHGRAHLSVVARVHPRDCQNPS